MSNITKLLTVADNVAFTNLFDVEIGASESARSNFNISLESITLDGADIEYTLNDSTKAHQFVKASRHRNLSIRVRERSNFYFYQYLLDWFLNFYDPINNVYVIGSHDNQADPIAGAVPETIVKNRTISIKAYGNKESSIPPFKMIAHTAKIQKLPSVSLDYKNSSPIVYDVSFVCDYIYLYANGLEIKPTHPPIS